MSGLTILLAVGLLFILELLIIVLGKALLIIFATKVVLKNTFSKLDTTFKKLLIYGLITDTISMALYIIYELNSSYHYVKDISHCIGYIFETLLSLSLFPYYDNVVRDGDYTTLIPIFIIFVLAIVIGVVINYICVFKKSDKPLYKRIFLTLGFSLCTAPFYYFISLMPIANVLG